MHAAKDREASRDLISGSWPPGVAVYYGMPSTASPYVQARLPNGWMHEKRASKAVSFQGDNPVTTRGTIKTKAMAEQTAMAWCWSWWGGLSDEDRSTIRSTEPSKKRKVDG